MKPDISRKQLIVSLLEKHEGAMNIDDIAVGISLPVEKVRQTLTTFDTDIVRVPRKGVEPFLLG